MKYIRKNFRVVSSSESSYAPSPSKKAKKEISFNEKKNALDFYRQPEKKSRSLSSMNKSFRFNLINCKIILTKKLRWIKTENDLKMLRRFENTRKNRVEAYRKIDGAVFKCFCDKKQKNLSITEFDLRRWAVRENYW